MSAQMKTPEGQKIRDLIRFSLLLSDRMGPDEADLWLQTPCDGLNGSIPMQLMENGNIHLLFEWMAPAGGRKSMTFDQFADFVNGISGDRPPWSRIGQYAFNLLNYSYPRIAGQVCGNDPVDPYYDDSKLPAFLSYILGEFVVMDTSKESGE